jgi:hypothetical protein
MERRQSTAAAAIVVALAGALIPAIAAAETESVEPPTWITAPDGSAMRVRFDPGDRLLMGALVDLRSTEGTGDARIAPLAPVLEIGLMLRSARPAPGWEVFWKREHAILHLHLRFRPTGVGAPALDGQLYRATFIRHSRAGAITVPTTPPLRLAVPFDIGVRVELGRMDGQVDVWPRAGAPGPVAGVVHGDVLLDFWRSPRPGRWITVGVGARYDIGLSRDSAGALHQDQRVAPMTALSLAARTESASGLASASVDVEGTHRWSSARGWEQTLRVEAEAEVVPLAINDLPLSLFARVGAELGGGLPGPDLRAIAGIRFALPLR